MMLVMLGMIMESALNVVMIIGMVMIIENNFVCLDSDIQTNSAMY